MIRTGARSSVLMGVSFVLCSCGTYAPSLSEGWETAEISDALVYRIEKSIYCEMVRAVRDYGTGKLSNVPAIPEDWAAQETLTLTADETGSFNPSVAPNVPYTQAPVFGGAAIQQSFSLPLTGALSSQAVRKDTYYWFFTYKRLKVDGEHAEATACSENTTDGTGKLSLDRRGSSYLLSGDVGIARWLRGALIAERAVGQSPVPKDLSQKNAAIQYDIKFVVLTTGTANPTWKFAVVSTGGGQTPLFSANRTRTHDLLLTFGPVDTSGANKNNPVPSRAVQDLHLTGEINSAVSTGFRSALQLPY